MSTLRVCRVTFFCLLTGLVWVSCAEPNKYDPNLERTDGAGGSRATGGGGGPGGAGTAGAGTGGSTGGTTAIAGSSGWQGSVDAPVGGVGAQTDGPGSDGDMDGPACDAGATRCSASASRSVRLRAPGSRRRPAQRFVRLVLAPACAPREASTAGLSRGPRPATPKASGFPRQCPVRMSAARWASVPANASPAPSAAAARPA